MKAAVVTAFGPSDVLRVSDVEAPASGPRDVLIRVVATSVNFAEYIAVHESLTFPIPDSLDFEAAAACPIVSFTVYALLADVARLAAGETVVIHAAAGGVGTTAVQLARILGAGQVIGTVGSPAKAQVAPEAGADHVLSYQDPDFVQQLLAITQGRGADVVLDSIGGDVSERSMDILRHNGRLVHSGSASGKPGRFETQDLHASCRSVLGFSLGTTRRERPHLLRPIAEAVLPLLAQVRLRM